MKTTKAGTSPMRRIWSSGAVALLLTTQTISISDALHGFAAPTAGSQTDFHVAPGDARFVNFTVTEASGPGYFQLMNLGDTIGAWSNANASVVGQTVAGASIVESTQADGLMQIYSQSGGHEIVDDMGGFTNSSFIEEVPNQRLFDSRPGGILPAGTVSAIGGGRPNSTAVLNLVATDVKVPGYIEILGSREEMPGLHSNLNATPGYTSAELATAKFDASGEIYIYNQSPTSLVVDLQGYFSPGSVDDIPDVRVLDTRLNGGQPVSSGTLTVVRGRPNRTALASLLGVDSQTANFIQVLGADQVPGSTSNLNTNPGQVVSNFAMISFDGDGQAFIYNNAVTHLVVDIQGYMQPGTYVSSLPRRMRDTRDGTMIVPPIKQQVIPSCGRVVWAEEYQDSQAALTYMAAVYDDATGQVTRFSLPDGTTETNLPRNVEYDPSNCADRSIVYAAKIPSSTRTTIYAMHLSDGAVSQLSTPFVAENQDIPEPQSTVGRVYFRTGISSIANLVRRTPDGQSIGSNVFDYSISDGGTTYADIKYFSDFAPGTTTLQEYTKVTVVRYADVTRQAQTESSYQFAAGGTEVVRLVHVSDDDQHVYLLRSTNGTPPKIMEVVDPTNSGVAKFVPVSFTASNNPNMTVDDFRAVGPSTVVALVTIIDPVTNISYNVMLKIDLLTGSTSTLAPTVGSLPIAVSM